VERYIGYMKTIKEFDNYTPLNEDETTGGSFDVARFSIAVKRCAAALEEHDIGKFVSIYSSQIKSVINSPEARQRTDLIKQLAESIEIAKEGMSPEEKREVFVLIMPKLTEQIDKDPELRAKYEI